MSSHPGATVGGVGGPHAFRAIDVAVPDFVGDQDRSHALVVVPSMSFDQQLLRNVLGIEHYEERLLALLLQLRCPTMHLVYCSSTRIPAEVVDYYLDLIPGVPPGHSRSRLTMISCDDPSPRPLTEKLLERPAALQQIEAALARTESAGIVAMNTTSLEQRLAASLGVPLLGNPPSLDFLGSKSGSRDTFRAAGVALPAGREHLQSMSEAVTALAELKAQRPDLAAAVVKLEEGFSGEGNAIYRYENGQDAASIAASLSTMTCQAPTETIESFARRFDAMGGVVEEFVPGVTASPSAQGYIGADEVWPLSTHDQVLGGLDGQVFEGSTFPADLRYRQQAQAAMLRVGEVLRARGARGRFAVDFVAVGDDLLAIEINLRQGGTTHPMLAMAVVTEGRYEAAEGTFRSATGRPKCYRATDNLQAPAFRGIGLTDLVSAAVDRGLSYDPVRERGCIFHIMGALSEYGKVGVTCIADTLAEATLDYEAVTDMMWDLGSR